MKSEPVVLAGTVSGAIIALLSAFGGIDAGVLETAVVALWPVALSFLARAKVTPVS